MLYSFIFPLIAALIFSVGSLTLKQANSFGMGGMRQVFITNWIFAIVFSLLLLIDCEVRDWSYWPYVLGAGLTNFVASVLLVLAIRAMHVSFLAPVLCSKVLFVSLFSVFIMGHSLPGVWWVAAGLATLALVLFGMTSDFRHHVVLKGVLCALSCSMLFALSDVLMGGAAQSFGPMAFVVGIGWILGIASLTLIPFFHKGLSTLSVEAWRFGLLGGGLLAIQATLLYVGIALSGEAAYANIVYSSRGLWGIVLVWFLGFIWKNDERLIGKKAMIFRVVGAILMSVSIALVLFYK